MLLKPKWLMWFWSLFFFFDFFWSFFVFVFDFFCFFFWSFFFVCLFVWSLFYAACLGSLHLTWHELSTWSMSHRSCDFSTLWLLIILFVNFQLNCVHDISSSQTLQHVEGGKVAFSCLNWQAGLFYSLSASNADRQKVSIYIGYYVC